MAEDWIDRHFPGVGRWKPLYIDKTKGADTTVFGLTYGGRQCGKTLKIQELFAYARSIGCTVDEQGRIWAPNPEAVQAVISKRNGLGL